MLTTWFEIDKAETTTSQEILDERTQRGLKYFGHGDRAKSDSTLDVDPTSLMKSIQLSDRESPSSEVEKKLMRKIPYALVVGSLMYVIVVTRRNLAYVIDDINRYISNPGKKL